MNHEKLAQVYLEKAKEVTESIKKDKGAFAKLNAVVEIVEKVMGLPSSCWGEADPFVLLSVMNTVYSSQIMGEFGIVVLGVLGPERLLELAEAEKFDPTVN